MSGTETERKFLVHKAGKPWREAATRACHIRQGYIPAEGATVRVRTSDDEAFLTIKSHSRDGGLSRYEFEHRITPDEARHLLALCQGGTIDKTRYLVPLADGHTIEVDEFHGPHDGLIIAEIELSAPDEPYERPPWLADEVTGDSRYYNSNLLPSAIHGRKD